MENIPIAVLALVLGVSSVAYLPTLLRKAHSVSQKTLVAITMAGGASMGLGLGGMVIASVAGASALAAWFGVAALIGLGAFLLPLLAVAAWNLWRRVVGKRHAPARQSGRR